MISPSTSLHGSFRECGWSSTFPPEIRQNVIKKKNNNLKSIFVHFSDYNGSEKNPSLDSSKIKKDLVPGSYKMKKIL